MEFLAVIGHSQKQLMMKAYVDTRMAGVSLLEMGAQEEKNPVFGEKNMVVGILKMLFNAHLLMMLMIPVLKIHVISNLKNVFLLMTEQTTIGVKQTAKVLVQLMTFMPLVTHLKMIYTVIVDVNILGNNILKILLKCVYLLLMNLQIYLLILKALLNHQRQKQEMMIAPKLLSGMNATMKETP